MIKTFVILLMIVPIPALCADEGRPADITPDQFEVIRDTCTKEWPRDYRMRAFCEQSQFEAIRELRKSSR